MLSTIVARYTEEIWYQHFLSLCPAKPQKIVLVSDFINKIGGIETYLHDVKALLESKGHEVRLRGGHLPKGIKGRLNIWFGLITFPFNFRSAWKFKRFLQREKPDLVRFHSLLRHL
ncbi:MAG: glycosyltransferase [Candidatus Peribacteria bacterium]|jgi:glycosyltransferase involved in cell wall biosynthesis|nr:glycosyltransferase [Candidatus Peribacteria bacterium]